MKTVHSFLFSRWLTCLLLLAGASATSAQTLLNFNFGAGTRTGAAAVGSTNDVWNTIGTATTVVSNYTYFGTTNTTPVITIDTWTNLVWANDTAFIGTVTLTNLTQVQSGYHADTMLGSLLGSNVRLVTDSDGTNSILINANPAVVVSDLPAGNFDFLIYGLGPNYTNADLSDKEGFRIQVGTNAASGWQWTTHPGTLNTNWGLNTQYVRFTNITVRVGEPALLTLAGNSNGFHLINGMQVVVNHLNVAPTVSLTGPASNSVFMAGTNITLSASASDSDGSVLRVDFYAGATLVGTATNSPYSVIWTNASAGEYQLTAVALDDLGATTASTAVPIRVRGAPTVAITSPTNSASFAALSSIAISATASVVGSTISKVEFFQGTTKLGEDSSYPYNITFPTAPGGTYALTAKATDIDGGTATSSTVTITVAAQAVGQVTTLSLSTNSVVGGTNLTATVTLDGPAVVGGQIVWLASSSQVAVVPASVTVPVGQTNISFQITTTLVTATNTAAISATFHTNTVTTNLQVRPNPLGPGSMALTEYGLQRGFKLTTFADGFSNWPLGVIQANNSVLVATFQSSVFRFPATSDGQHLDDAIDLSNTVGFPTSIHFAKSGTNYYVRTGVGNLMQINPDGTPYQTNGVTVVIATDISGWGMVTHPLTGEIFLQGGDGIVRVNPTTGERVEFETAFMDGITISADGGTIYGGYEGELYGWETTNFTKVFDLNNGDANPVISGVDGVVLGRGVLTGKLYVNSTEGKIYEVDLATRDVQIIAQGGTRGDFMHIMPDGTMMATDTDRIYRLTPPSGSGFARDTRAIFVRDDVTGTQETLHLEPPYLSAETAAAARFDLAGISGTLLEAKMRRAGQLDQAGGARLDLQLGIRTTTGGGLYSYAPVMTNLNTFPTNQSYPSNLVVAEWDLAADVRGEIISKLGTNFSVLLADAINSASDKYVVEDRPQFAWPYQRNRLTLLLGDQPVGIPQGRCVAVTRPGSELPLNGQWDVLLDDTIIASSGSPNGWLLADDYSAHGGVVIAAPASATVTNGYQFRFSGNHSGSGQFNVVAAGSPAYAVTVRAIELLTNALTGGLNATGTVHLDAVAPAGGVTVAVFSGTQPEEAALLTVAIAAGQSNGTFAVSTPSVSEPTAVNLWASLNGVRKTTLTLLGGSGSAPAAPTGVSATQSGSQVLVQWSAVSGADSYTVKRGTARGGPYTTVFTGLTATRYYDPFANQGTNYHYVVSASNAWGEGTNSAEASLPPAGGLDSFVVSAHGGAQTLPVLTNDVAPYGDTLTVVAVTQPVHGLVSIVESGAAVSYAPVADYLEPDEFTYTVSDGHGGTSVITVHVDVNAVNVLTPAPLTLFQVGASPVLTAETISTKDTAFSLVKWYAGTNLLAEVANAPYSFTWTNGTAGTHTLSAVGTDALGNNATSAPVQVAFEPAPTDVLNVRLGAGAAKTGPAAVGLLSSDFWNVLAPANEGTLTRTNLLLAGGAMSGVRAQLENALGIWQNGASDPLLAAYGYGGSGTNVLTLRLTNLTAGLVSIYLYGHGARDEENSAFTVTVGGATNTVKATAAESGWAAPYWREGIHCVAYRDLVVGATDEVVIQAGADAGAYGYLSGIQIALRTNSFVRLTNSTAQPDFNRDGNVDALLSGTAADNARLWMFSGTNLTQVFAVLGGTNQNLRCVAAADFNRDGHTDLVWRDAVTGANQLWLGRAGFAWEVVAFDAETNLNWTIQAAADFDGNGYPDLLWQNAAADVARIWFMQGTRRINSGEIGGFYGATPVAAGDFDLDGMADILWRNLTNGVNTVWIMHGTTNQSTFELDTETNLTWSIVGVGDLDGSGKLDILWRNTNGSARLWLMDGTTFLSSVSLGTPVDTAVPDADADGVPDWVELALGTSPTNATSTVATRLGWWRFNNGDWVGERGQVPTLVSNVQSVASWSGEGVRFDSGGPALLNYRASETDGWANLAPSSGTVQFWFRPSWQGTNMGGTGPGAAAHLIDVGHTASAGTNDYWMLQANAAGTELAWASRSQGTQMVHLTFETALTAQQWHLVTLTYTPTNSALFVDGLPVASGTGVTALGTNALAHGFRIGSDEDGAAQAKGDFDEVETFNFPLSAEEIWNHYAGLTAQHPELNLAPNFLEAKRTGVSQGGTVDVLITRPKPGNLLP